MVLDLCQSRTRRYALAHLATKRKPVSVARLADAIRRRRSPDDGMDDSDTETTDLFLSLQHCHLPKLAESSVIEYDTDRGVIEPTDSFGQLEPHLSALIEADPAIPMAVES